MTSVEHRSGGGGDVEGPGSLGQAEPPRPVRVISTDDAPLVRGGVALVRPSAGIEERAQVDDGDALLEAVARCRPDASCGRGAHRGTRRGGVPAGGARRGRRGLRTRWRSWAVDRAGPAGAGCASGGTPACGRSRTARSRTVSVGRGCSPGPGPASPSAASGRRRGCADRSQPDGQRPVEGTGRGRPRRRPHELRAGDGHDNRRCRRVVERSVGWLLPHERLALRYDTSTRTATAPTRSADVPASGGVMRAVRPPAPTPSTATSTHPARHRLETQERSRARSDAAVGELTRAPAGQPAACSQGCSQGAADVTSSTRHARTRTAAVRRPPRPIAPARPPSGDPVVGRFGVRVPVQAPS